jgi:hypothetical protein
MKAPRQKISAAQGWQIMQVYLHLGSGPAGELALEYGVSRHYGNSLANELGLQPARKFNGSGKISSTVNHNDSRWSRAVAVGCVVAGAIYPQAAGD